MIFSASKNTIFQQSIYSWNIIPLCFSTRLTFLFFSVFDNEKRNQILQDWFNQYKTKRTIIKIQIGESQTLKQKSSRAEGWGKKGKTGTLGRWRGETDHCQINVSFLVSRGNIFYTQTHQCPEASAPFLSPSEVMLLHNITLLQCLPHVEKLDDFKCFFLLHNKLSITLLHFILEPVFTCMDGLLATQTY